MNIPISADTEQFIIRLFAILVFVAMIGVMTTFAVIIWRDGNTPEVQTAFNSMVTFGTWITGIVGGVLVIRPVATATQTIFQARAEIASAQAQKISEATPEQVVASTSTQPPAAIQS